MRKTIVIALMCVLVAGTVGLIVWVFVEQRRQDLEARPDDPFKTDLPAPADSAAAAFSDTTASVGGP